MWLVMFEKALVLANVRWGTWGRVLYITIKCVAPGPLDSEATLSAIVASLRHSL